MDVYTDLSLIIPWFIGQHYIYGTSMTIPLLLSFLSITYKWYKIEEPHNKRWSWIFLLLQCWPQLRALRVIRKVYKGYPNANEEKKTFNTELGIIEPFLEAWPSHMIMTAISTQALWKGCDVDNCNDVNLVVLHVRMNWTCSDVPEIYSLNRCAVFGGSSDSFRFLWFWITLLTSLIAASFGITKLLMVGPSPILTEEGRLGGILTCSFLTHFLAVMLSMGSKANFLGNIIGMVSGNIDDDPAAPRSAGYEGDWFLTIVTCILLTLAPNIIMSLVSIATATGCNKKFFQIVLLLVQKYLL